MAQGPVHEGKLPGPEGQGYPACKGHLKAVSEEAKPKRVSLPEGKVPADVDLAYAVQLLSLPRTVGTDPATDDNSVRNAKGDGATLAFSISLMRENL